MSARGFMVSASAAIKAIRADGTYKRIQDRYFDFDVYGDTK